MKVIPAIDIKGGKVVRLTQGRADRQTVYFDSPVDVARSLDLAGVDLIHVVDLDGALEGSPKNLNIVKKMVKSVKARIELGGGIRDEKAIKSALDAGIDRVVIGTRAIEEYFLTSVVDKFKERIVVGIDAREGFIYTKGWVAKTDKKAVEFAKSIEQYGIKTINYTDIAQDGMLKGPNIESLRQILAATSIDVIAAGGVSGMDDLIRLKELEKEGLKGVIIGKALYEKKIDLKEAIKLCSQKG